MLRRSILRKLNSILKWSTVQLAVSTMVFSPVALGREVEALNKKNLQQTLSEFGLDKKTTLSEFWEKSKTNFPAFVTKDLEKFVQQNKNLLMPQMTLTTSKTTSGLEIPVASWTEKGKTHSIQFFGEKDKWAKYDNIVLSENDIENVSAIFKRIEASDLRLRKQADKVRQSELGFNATYVKDFARFEGFPRVTPTLWKSLTQEQRAGYIIKMRLMWEASRNVLDLKNPQLSPSEKKTSSLEKFYKTIFLGADAEAQSKAAPEKQAIGQACSPKAPYSGKACIAAGFVKPEENNYALSYNSNSPTQLTCACNYDTIIKKNKIDDQNANTQMKSECRQENSKYNSQIKYAENGDWVPCNPLVYSYKANGSPFCVHTMSPGFQRATTYTTSGVPTMSCDEQARLSTTQFAVTDSKGYKSLEERAKKIESEQRSDKEENDFLLTRKYIDGALKRQGVDKNLKELLEGQWNPDMDKKLVDIQMAFESEIKDATRLCSANLTNQEGNFRAACDQLHRRWLFTEKFIAKFRAKACEPNATYIGAYEKNESSFSEKGKVKTDLNKRLIDVKGTNLCECKDVKNKTVNFGELCSKSTPIDTSAKCPTGMTKEDAFCMCNNGTAGTYPINTALDRASHEGGIEKMCPGVPADKCDKPKGIVNFDYEKCECKSGELKNENEATYTDEFASTSVVKKESKYVCKESNSHLWLLGLGALGLIAFFHKGKRSVAQTPPASCAPKVGTPPNCICPANNSCNLVNQYYNMETCMCDTRAVCATGTPAPDGNIAKCLVPTPPPTPQPPAPGPTPTPTPTPVPVPVPVPTPPPSEGGTGSPSCPSGGCSGGVPTKPAN